MKVKAIEPYKAKDQTNRWKVIFEEIPDTPLILGKEPSFQAGADIDADKLNLVQKGDYSYYTWKHDQPKNEKRSYGRSIEETNAIKAQVAVKAIVDLEVAGKLDEFTESKNTLAIGAREWLKAALIHDNELVAEAIKLGAKVK